MNPTKASGPGAARFGIVGTSPAIVKVVRFIQEFGPTEYPVLITGDTGTGKELAAQAIRTVSHRHPLVPVNCGAIPPHLIASELFGHTKGAFTGADGARRGHFVAAARGSLFLDEIAELPYPQQSTLLRVLDEGEIVPVGTSRPKRVNVRVIAATNRDLEQEVKERRFRDDLYWRLRQVWTKLPPLRERLGDVPLLAQHFAEGTPITKRAMSILESYLWPGNVRQLRSVIAVARVRAGDGPIRTAHVNEAIETPEFAFQRDGSAARPVSAEAPYWMRPRHDLVREQMLRVFDATGHDPRETASILDVSLSTVYRNLQAYGALPSPRAVGAPNGAKD